MHDYVGNRLMTLCHDVIGTSLSSYVSNQTLNAEICKRSHFVPLYEFYKVQLLMSRSQEKYIFSPLKTVFLMILPYDVVTQCQPTISYIIMHSDFAKN